LCLGFCSVQARSSSSSPKSSLYGYGNAVSGGQRSAGAQVYANCLKRIVNTKLNELATGNLDHLPPLIATRKALAAQAKSDGFGPDRCDMLFPALWHVLSQYRVSL
jgi:hypothetical protein